MPEPRFFVDPPMVTAAAKGTQAHRVGARNGHEWCHLWTDGTDADLLAFGGRIGLLPEWIQRSRRGLVHFDLTPGRRVKAIAAGALPLGRRDAVENQRRCRVARIASEVSRVR